MNPETIIPGLGKGDLDPDPLRQFAAWYEAAIAAGVLRPDAMALATVTPDGEPANRLVLLKGVDGEGFVFFTDNDSDKGRDLAARPRAALLFYWPNLHRQVRVVGTTSPVSAGESDTYFASRPRGSQLSAWASRQSQFVESRAVLERRMEQLDAQYEGRAVPRPPYWGGYRLAPDTVEFWQGRPDRLHDRLRYSRQPDGSWLVERLGP
jgi:pyridoxamine 5'-phosphate oxidase